MVLAALLAPSTARAQAPAPAPPVIHWFVDNTTDAYDLGVAQHKPIVLVTGDFSGMYFRRLKNEVLLSPQLAQLAPYAIFVYADPSHDVVARNFGKALGYDRWPVISLLGPNGAALNEQARLVGLWSAETVVTQLSIHMRSNGWLPAAPSTSRPPWLPPHD